MGHIKYNWTTKDGLNIYSQGWIPDTQLKGVICLVHGLGEHCNRYTELGGFLSKNGFALHSFDIRGHGKSEGKRGHTSHFDTLLYDLTDFIMVVKQRHPKTPLFLYGHSMGGLVVLKHALKFKSPISGIIASAPLLKIAYKPSGWKLVLARLVYSLFPSLTMTNEIRSHDLSSINEVREKYRNDPLVHDKVSVGLGIGFFDAGQWCIDNATRLEVPSLIMHGTQDRITLLEASSEFYKKQAKLCTFKTWDGFMHELHNEPGKQDVFYCVLDWLQEQINEISNKESPENSLKS